MNRELLAAKKRQEIAIEYGEPFVDVVKGFRKQGVPWRVIAGTLGITFDTLRGWAKSFGLNDNAYMRSAPHPEPLNDRARELGYDGVSDMIVSYWKEHKTKGDVATDLGCKVHSLTRFIPIDMKGTVPYTEKQKAAWKANVERINQRRRDKYEHHR